jgi:hypothetical protein
MAKSFNEKGIKIGDKVTLLCPPRVEGRTANVIEVYRDSVFVTIRGVSKGVLYDNEQVKKKKKK